MKALSLIQPWASLIGVKEWETRSWPTTFRGEVAIHASKGFPEDERRLCLDKTFGTALRSLGFVTLGDIPRGAIVAVATLTDCRRTEDLRDSISDQEHEFGDFSRDRFAFRLDAVRRLAVPVPCRGSLGFWPVPPDVEALVREQIGAVVTP